MFRNLLVLVLLFISSATLAAPLSCLNHLRSLQGLNPLDVQRSYLLKVLGTLYGELDPYILGDGGIMTATLISDAGKTNSSLAPDITFVIYEKDQNHPKVSKIDKAFYKGWTYLLLKRSCVAEVTNKKQMQGMNELVRRHLIPPNGSRLKFYSFE